MAWNLRKKLKGLLTSGSQHRTTEKPVSNSITETRTHSKPLDIGLNKYKLSDKSKRKLIGVHPDLVAVVELAIKITEQDFTVLEGMRTKERQRKLVKSGASKTMNSRHLTGHAVDIAPYVNGSVSWDWAYYWAVEDAMKAAAKELGVDLEWGGDWKSFKDGPHWQLSWKKYK